MYAILSSRRCQDLNLTMPNPPPERIRALEIDSIIAEADPPLVGWFQFPIASRLKQASDEGRKEDEALLALLHIVVAMGLHGDDPKRPFRPAVVMTDGSRTPLPEDFGDEHFETLMRIRELVNNIELKARISDVLWQRKKRDVQDAKVAIQAYLACAKAPGINRYERHQRVKRAFQPFSMGLSVEP